MHIVSCFVFQAEDGIRDLVRSRGLGDVYKRQYWGRGCQVAFQHGDAVFYHKGLVILSGPMRAPLRQARQEQLTALAQQLTHLRDKLGQPYHRTLKAVQRKANGLCRTSKVGDLMTVVVCETTAGAINLHWEVNRAALYQAEKKDGRYLLVTNDWSLTCLLYTSDSADERSRVDLGGRRFIKKQKQRLT